MEAGVTGKDESGALQASLESGLSPKEYEFLRLRLRELAGALASDEASGARRAGLYCERARVYERLAQAHELGGEPILVGREAGVPLERVASSVLLVAVSSGTGYQALGSAVLVKTGQGTKVLTDAGVILDPETGLAKTGLLAFARPSRPGEPLRGPHPVEFERIERLSNLALASLAGGQELPGLELASSEVSQGELLRAIGHGSATGGWTVSQGLVTAGGTRAYRSDALLGPDSAGSALINDAGELAGVAVGDESGVHAIQASVIKDVLEGRATEPMDAGRELGPDFNAGSAAILTRAVPFDLQAYASPSEGALEAGLTGGSVDFDGRGGGSRIGVTWRPSSSSPPSWGSSSWGSRSSSWSSGSSSRSSWSSGYRVRSGLAHGQGGPSWRRRSKEDRELLTMAVHAKT